MSWKGRGKAWNYWPHTPKKQQKNKGTGRGKSSKEPSIPGYDAVLPSSSASGSTTGDSDLKRAMQSLVEANKLSIPDDLKALLETNGLESVKQEQQVLNKRKKLLSKIERLKQGKVQRTQALARYKDEMIRKLRSEQERYDKEMEDIEQSIQSAQLELDKLENGLPEEEDEEDLQTLLKDPEKEILTQQLEQERQRSQQAQEQLLALQRQLQTYKSTSTNVPYPENGDKLEIEVQDAEKRARKERMKKVEEAFAKNTDRERSPRRDSQDSVGDMQSLG